MSDINCVGFFFFGFIRCEAREERHHADGELSDWRKVTIRFAHRDSDRRPELVRMHLHFVIVQHPPSENTLPAR